MSDQQAETLPPSLLVAEQGQQKPWSHKRLQKRSLKGRDFLILTPHLRWPVQRAAGTRRPPQGSVGSRTRLRQTAPPCHPPITS